MRRSLRRAATLLLAAGAVGMGCPAQAQYSSEVNNVAPSQPSSGQAQLERMKVELAWLADLACFSQRLDARVAGSSLEVRGTVPDEHIHEQALRVARQNCFLPVIDALTVTAPGVRARPTASVEEIRQAVTKHLVRTFGQRAAGFDVQASADGKVFLNGSVVSVEDKLAISRCLREVPNWACVINKLSVTPALHGGQTVTLVSTDGKLMVRGALPTASITPNTLQPVSASHPLEEGEVQLPRVVTGASMAEMRPSGPTMTLPSGLPPVRPTQGSSSYWYQGSMSYAAPPTPSAPPTPTWASQGGGGCPTCPTCAGGAAQPAREASLFPFLSRVNANRSANPPLANPSASPYASARMQPVAYYQPANMPAAGQPGVQPRLGPSMPVSAPAQPSMAPPDSVSAMRLQQLVCNGCGNLARKVEISMQRDRSLLVQVQATNSAAERQLIERLMKIPEITQPGVHLEVTNVP